MSERVARIVSFKTGQYLYGWIPHNASFGFLDRPRVMRYPAIAGRGLVALSAGLLPMRQEFV
jgi:hypothetical protein